LRLIGPAAGLDGESSRILEIAGQETIEANFTLDSMRAPERVVRGVIRDDAGRPATEVLVMAVQAEGRTALYARTDAQGRYALRVGDGDVLLYARDRPGGRVATAWVGADLDTSDAVDIDLQSPATVIGRVIDRWGDTPSGVSLEVAAEPPLDGGDTKVPPLRWAVKTGDGGWYHLGAIPPGSRVTIRCPRGEVVVDRAVGEGIRAEVLILKEEPATEAKPTPLPDAEPSR
jgi:hypothetical protein